jgi:hypothetical protein
MMRRLACVSVLWSPGGIPQHLLNIYSGQVHRFIAHLPVQAVEAPAQETTLAALVCVSLALGKKCIPLNDPK